MVDIWIPELFYKLNELHCHLVKRRLSLRVAKFAAYSMLTNTIVSATVTFLEIVRDGIGEMKNIPGFLSVFKKDSK